LFYFILFYLILFGFIMDLMYSFSHFSIQVIFFWYVKGDAALFTNHGQESHLFSFSVSTTETHLDLR